MLLPFPVDAANSVTPNDVTIIVSINVMRIPRMESSPRSQLTIGRRDRDVDAAWPVLTAPR